VNGEKPIPVIGVSLPGSELWGCGVVPTEDKGVKAFVRTFGLNTAGWKTGTCKNRYQGG